MNNNAGYSPDNCRYASAGEQQRNKRNNNRLTAYGQTKTRAEWARDERCTVTLGGLNFRLRAGMPHQDAISRPRFEKRKLSDEDTATIVSLRESQKQDAELAARFGIHVDYVRKLVARERRRVSAGLA